jgi:hypothetical protein
MSAPALAMEIRLKTTDAPEPADWSRIHVRLFAPAVGAAVLLLTALGCWLPAIAGPVVAIAAALLTGFAMGAEVDLIAYLVSRYFGLRHFGAINGCGYAAYNVGAACSPFLVGVLFSFAGSYALALEIMAADASIQFRVTPEVKTLVRAPAEREQITESALVKQLLQVVLRTAALLGFPNVDTLDKPNRTRGSTCDSTPTIARF